MSKKRQYCPIMKEICTDGWTKKMGEDKDGVRPQCRFWTVIKGKDPQSNKEYEDGDCAIAWMPIIQLETSQKTMGVTAAVEDIRNRIVNELGNAIVKKEVPTKPNPPYQGEAPSTDK